MKVSEAIVQLSNCPADFEVGIFRVSHTSAQLRFVFQPLVTVTEEKAHVGLAFGKPEEVK